MPAQLSGRDQRRLNDKKQNPRHISGGMDMHQKIGKWRAHEAGKQVTISEPEDDGEDDSRYEQGEEGMF
jgi:hypothetical protein